MKFCAYCEHPNSAIIIKTFFFGFVIMVNGKEGTQMGNQSVISIEAVIDYIESHLDGKLELETVAAVSYTHLDVYKRQSPWAPAMRR